MAKQTITKILDDLTGEEADETVSFALDGNAFDIDLTAAHASELRAFLETYIEAGTRTGRVGNGAQLKSYRSNGSASVQTARTNREENQAIRTWAQGNNFQLSERGRIPQHIVDAYHQRHNTAAALNREVKKAQQAAAEPAKSEPAKSEPAKNGAAPRKRAPAKAAFSGAKIPA